MKLIFTLLFSLSLISCGGLSEKERQNIVDTTCAVLKETNESQSAFRVQELNFARESLGEDVFTDGDNVVYDAIQLGLCESLVANSSDFEQTFATKLREKLEADKKAFIESSCEQLNLSYVSEDSSEEDEYAYYQEMYRGYDFDDEFIDDVNLRKSNMIADFKKMINSPPFQGDVIDIVKLQFFGLCDELLVNDLKSISDTSELYTNTIKSLGNESHAYYISNYVSKEGDIYFKKVADTDNGKKITFVKSDNAEEITNLEFEGVVQTLYQSRILITRPIKFELKNSNYIGEIITYYNNGKLRSLFTHGENGLPLKSQTWYFDGKTNTLTTYQDGKRLNYTKYDHYGDIVDKYDYIEGKKEGLGLEWGFETCFKDGERVDLNQCK